MDSRMVFALIKISGSKLRGSGYAYSAVLMEVGASTKWTRTFLSEEEMVEIVNHILARQRTVCDIRLVLDKVRYGGHYFFDLDLTPQGAQSLGWQEPQQR